MNSDLLDAESIFDVAAKIHGLEQYAEQDIKKRFAELIASINDQGVIEEWAKPAAIEQLSATVKNRLEIARDRAMYPEIANEQITQPFFVVGSGRTGSTLMQVLLSLGDGCRLPLSWEVRRSSPPPGLDTDSEKARIAIENAHINELINIAPGLLLSHPYVDQGAFMEVEDEDLFAVDFHTAFPWHFTRVPTLPIAHHKRESGLIDALRFHKQLLQHLQWKRPTEHWVCKTTQHFFELPKTWEVYPDARCIWTHRDPVVFISSLLGILDHFYRPLTGLIIRGAVADEIVNSQALAYEAVTKADWLNDERLIHVQFDDFVKDQVGSIRTIYERSGLDFTPGYEQRMRGWLSDPQNRSNRHGKFIYSLEQFGLDEAEVRGKFSSYYDRFLNENQA